METMMEKSQIGTLKFSLRSRTADTFLQILSICSADSSHIIQSSDKGTESVPSDCNDTIPNDFLFQQQMPVDETCAVFDTQESGLCNKHMESPQHDLNLLGGEKDLSHKVNINPSVNLDIQSQDKDVEGLEILEDLMALMPETDIEFVDKSDSDAKDFINAKAGLENDSDSILLRTETVKNGSKEMGVVNKTRRNLVSYAEIEFDSERAPEFQSNSTINATKNQDGVYPLKNRDAPNNKKRPNSGTKEERRNKKSKKSVVSSTSPENPTSHGEQNAIASQEAVGASENNVAAIKKKKRQVMTKEVKAKKRMKARMKRAEENRKLGIKRLRLQPVVKEKKVTYCRHYMNGRCHEGEKCKFSHDTTPLTKSKPCCHFARHACMKGDDCPYDHELSKYPCINYQTKGSCGRGSACMFSHEAQPSDTPINASNESKPENTPPSDTSFQKAETKSSSVPKFVDITPKPARPPKGINFLSQEKVPLESSQVQKITKTPPVFQDSKEITKTPLVQDSNEITKTPIIVQDSKELSKAPPAIPRGINFLSFGKKPGLDSSNGGFSFKISNRIEKPQSIDLEGEGSKSKSMLNEIKVDSPADELNTSKKPMHMMPFMSSTSQKALHSTLAFASKFDFGVKSKV